MQPCRLALSEVRAPKTKESKDFLQEAPEASEDGSLHGSLHGFLGFGTSCARSSGSFHGPLAKQMPEIWPFQKAIHSKQSGDWKLSASTFVRASQGGNMSPYKRLKIAGVKQLGRLMVSTQPEDATEDSVLWLVPWPFRGFVKTVPYIHSNVAAVLNLPLDYVRLHWAISGCLPCHTPGVCARPELDWPCCRGTLCCIVWVCQFSRWFPEHFRQAIAAFKMEARATTVHQGFTQEVLGKFGILTDTWGKVGMQMPTQNLFTFLLPSSLLRRGLGVGLTPCWHYVFAMGRATSLAVRSGTKSIHLALRAHLKFRRPPLGRCIQKEIKSPATPLIFVACGWILLQPLA